MLHIPELDDRLETPSMRTFVDSPMWNRPLAVQSWQAYLGDLAGHDVPAYAAPARATDLSGLPPAYVSTAENDPLRDEGIIYALRLLQAGVSVELHQFPGTFHGSAVVTTAACRSGPSGRRRWCSAAALGRRDRRRGGPRRPSTQSLEHQHAHCGGDGQGRLTRPSRLARAMSGCPARPAARSHRIQASDPVTNMLGRR